MACRLYVCKRCQEKLRSGGRVEIRYHYPIDKPQKCYNILRQAHDSISVKGLEKR